MMGLGGVSSARDERVGVSLGRHVGTRVWRFLGKTGGTWE